MTGHFADGLFRIEHDGSVRLIAGRRRQDGRMRFPLPQGTEASSYEPVVLPSVGRLWSVTVQRFRPKSPPYAADDAANFKPYAVAYVEFPGQLIVEGRLNDDGIDDLRIGMRMQTSTMPFRASDGREGLIYTFEPAAGSAPP